MRAAKFVFIVTKAVHLKSNQNYLPKRWDMFCSTRLLLPFICIIYVGLEATAQSHYSIVSIAKPISMKLPKVKDSLNKQLANVTDKKEVFTIINKRLRNFHNAPLKIMETMPDSSHIYHIYSVAGPIDAIISFRDVTGSRSFNDETIYKRYEFANLFADTLVLFDTLTVKVFPSDFKFPIDSYYFLNESSEKISIPSSTSNTIAIFASLFRIEDGLTSHLTLYNSALSNRKLGECYFHFLSAEEKNELKELTSLLNTPKMLASNVITEELTNYIKLNWGNVSRKSMLSWINTQR